MQTGNEVIVVEQDGKPVAVVISTKVNPTSAGDHLTEQLASIERLLWSTPVDAAVEPWVTPPWRAADAARTVREADHDEQ